MVDPASFILVLQTLQSALLLLVSSCLKFLKPNVITKGTTAAAGVPVAIVSSDVLVREAARLAPEAYGCHGANGGMTLSSLDVSEFHQC